MNHKSQPNKIGINALFTTALLSSLTIQLLAQGTYPSFEHKAIESKAQASAIHEQTVK